MVRWERLASCTTRRWKCNLRLAIYPELNTTGCEEEPRSCAIVAHNQYNLHTRLELPLIHIPHLRLLSLLTSACILSHNMELWFLSNAGSLVSPGVINRFTAPSQTSLGMQESCSPTV